MAGPECKIGSPRCVQAGDSCGLPQARGRVRPRGARRRVTEAAEGQRAPSLVCAHLSGRRQAPTL
ncbi:hypothetical protein PF008_g25404 [Phytophthora fragariae]|uniref:Uncharacterized protein n=1 Tax=Phytophthora fragariae TaxID=53985 RepID=A0A6G0QKP3_9STRA|nr:hypothetical protein PF008_g25404 [Phytophthora fragariae]